MRDLVTRCGKALLISFWIGLLCFPLLGLKVNARTSEITFVWERMISLLVVVFVLACFWLWYFQRKESGGEASSSALLRKASAAVSGLGQRFKVLSVNQTSGKAFLGVLAIALVAWPLINGSMYQTTIFTSAFIYVMLALGLNIIVGVAGQLVLGYAAFFAIGAYTYGLLYYYLGWSFWACLPLAGLLTTVAGILLGLPVLRLRGDYLAIVTLGFGEIVRLLLTNFSDFTQGAKGISGIPQPSIFGLELNSAQKAILLYYLALLAAWLTIVVVRRLRDSRIGLGLQAMREDEVAGEAMGIDPSRAKLIAFALSSCWAGFAGVFTAARTTYISPSSFNFMESAMILSMVVLGGMGSIVGVVIAAAVLTLLPEYLRAFSEYRMLIFGALMVIMMIFRPQGLIPPGKRKYSIDKIARPEGKIGQEEQA